MDKIIRELCSGCFGNGITIWVKGTETTVAHIDYERNITWYVSNLTKKEKAYVTNIAEKENRAISATQLDQFAMKKI